MRFFQRMLIDSPKSSTSYKLPVMLRFVNSCNRKPKIHAKSMALKNDGTLIPNVLMIWIVLSIKVSLYNAEMIPNIIPSNMAILIAATAKTMVFGKVSLITCETLFPDFWNDSRKYGNFITIVVFPMAPIKCALITSTRTTFCQNFVVLVIIKRTSDLRCFCCL